MQLSYEYQHFYWLTKSKFTATEWEQIRQNCVLNQLTASSMYSCTSIPDLQSALSHVPAPSVLATNQQNNTKFSIRKAEAKVNLCYLNFKSISKSQSSESSIEDTFPLPCHFQNKNQHNRGEGAIQIETSKFQNLDGHWKDTQNTLKSSRIYYYP